MMTPALSLMKSLGSLQVAMAANASSSTENESNSNEIINGSSSRNLVFSLNGQRVELPSPDPTMTLLTYLHSYTPLKGTKLSCGDGGCGACLVLFSKYDLETQSVEHHSINSCITPLCSIDGCSITTIEGIGSIRTGLHSVQERITGFHGSQCGFCTPGMCMSMYSCFLNSVPDSGVHHTIPALSLADAQTAIVGNICRCTGYRPILDACKSFSSAVDIEDLGINTFWDSSNDANINLLPPFQMSSLHWTFPQFLIEELRLAQQMSETCDCVPTLSVFFTEAEQDKVWIQVNTLPAAFNALSRYQASNSCVKLVVGNTSSGYYKDEQESVFVDISRVPELLRVQEGPASLVIGAAVTIEKLIQVLENRRPIKDEDSITSGLISHLKRVGNSHVRHRASVGGNLIMAQRNLFGSDLVTLFLAIGASVQLISSNVNGLIFGLEDFLLQRSIEPSMILESITLPLETGNRISDRGTNNGNSNPTVKQVFKSYRAAPRELGNSLAWINAAFLATISPPSEGNPHYNIVDVKLAFGAFGNAQAIRTYTVENFLRTKSIDESTLLQAIKILKTELAPNLKGTTKSNYRASLAVGFFFKFFIPFLPSHSDLSGISSKDSKAWTNHNDFHVSSNQYVPKYEEDKFLGEPIQKSEGKIQATGEAVYVDDIPSPEHCLFAAFVLSSKAYARIKSIDPAPALSCPGVVAFISAQDIPEGGLNVGPIPFSGDELEPLFADDTVMYIGHPIGVVVADSPQHAKQASGKVIVEYEETMSPTLCIEDAVIKDSFLNIPPSPLFIDKKTIGDVGKGFHEAEQRIIDAEVRTGSQYHFYMETQTALAIPDEDECMLVYSSSQSIDFLQKSLSVCLGLPAHNIRVITRRAGGGFGGKAFRNITIANACAVSAYRLRRPVRMYLDRKTDMITTGGRHPTKTLYSVGFKSNGKITTLKAQIFIDCGWSTDLSPTITLGLLDGLQKYDWGSMDADLKLCKTNLSSKTFMRAPGHVQGSFIADTVIEHVAAALNVDVHTVITRNMHTCESLKLFFPRINTGGEDGFILPSMWDRMLKRMESKQNEISSFNSMNRWTKRGLSILPCVYSLHQASKPARVTIFQDGSVVVEVGGIEIGQGLWTKVKQAVAHGLSPLLPADSKGLESLKIRVVQSDSISLPYGGVTGGSTVSEASCEAARQACQVLLDRLMPVKVKQEQDLNKSLPWIDLIKMARFANVDLAAQVQWFPARGSNSYLNYGVAATEIELDILTGGVKIVETDLVYDCGRSLNPAVDIGQIEGAFVQGIGFFLTEELEVDSNGELLSTSTWTYKPPTIDNIPQKFSVELVNGPAHKNRILSSKASGEPPLLLSGTIHSAVRHAIEAAREDHLKDDQKQLQDRYFRLDTPATMEKVRNLCGDGIVENHLKHHIIKT